MAPPRQRGGVRDAAATLVAVLFVATALRLSTFGVVPHKGGTLVEASPRFLVPRSEESNFENHVGSAEAEKTAAEAAIKSTEWRSHYFSLACQGHRMRPVGRAATGTVGQGQRAACLDTEDTEELRKELLGSVDVSISYRLIYVPVMKVATQMFAEVLHHRFGAVRMLDKDVMRTLKRHKLELSDMFVFTVVRSPLSTFRSGYGEMSLYAAHDKIAKLGFTLIPQVEENEPGRAMQCLEDVKHGVFAGLVPAHLNTQVWKTTRCIGRARIPLSLNFVGHLENIEEDWRYVESRLGVPNVPLPLIHASDVSKERVMAKQMIKFDPASGSERFSNLTRVLCDYYKSDFECFGYDASVCN